MASDKFRGYIALTSLGFLAAIVINVFMFVQFQKMTSRYSEFSHEIHTYHKGYTEQIAASNLSSMTDFLEAQYPVLHDMKRLKQEARSDWFWDIADEWHEIAATFNYAQVFYIEKAVDGYRIVISSEIRRKEHPEWLGNLVWKNNSHPAFYDQAWGTKLPATSPEPYRGENGTYLSVVKPIVTNGAVSGLLCIDYNISIINTFIQQEAHLKKYETTLIQQMGGILVLATIVILIAMGSQIWLNNTSVMAAARERETEDRTKLMLDATPMLCGLWDKDGKLLDCNAETLKVFRFDKKTDYIEHFFDLIPEFQPDGERTRDMLARLTKELRINEKVNIEMMYHTRWGEELPLATTMVRVPWQDTYRVTTYGWDLRKIKEKEAIAEESQKRMRIMLDSMSFACFFFDMDGKPVDCNRRAIELFACKDKKEALKQFFNFSPEYQPDGRPSIETAKKVIHMVFEQGELVTPWLHRSLDGTLIPSELSLVRVEWQGEYRVIGYIRDLSKLAKAEDNLRRALSIVETTPNLALCINKAGNIEFMNDAVIEVSGFSERELNQNGLSLMFNPLDYEVLEKEYIATAGKKPFNFEMPLVTKYGEKRTIYFAIFTMPLKYSSPCIGLIGRDVTEYKQMQHDIEQAKEQAERALASEKQYNKAKSNFLSRVSHELRTPMNAIIGMTDIAKKAIERNEWNNCFERFSKIEEAARHLLHIVNDVLDMANLDTGKFELEPRQFSFTRAMRAVVDETSIIAAEKGHEFVVTIDEGIYDALIGDERRLKQLLNKLLSNAVKFTPEGGRIELSAKVKQSSMSTCTIHFEIIDNGIGIGRDIQQILGRSFEQEHDGTTREYSGMGLGLSLSKRIAELMNGQIWVESETGKGSCFMCDIVLRTALAAKETPEKTSEALTMTVQNLNGRRFLIVDDIEINRVIMFAILEETGVILDEARDGAEAVELCSRNNYDLVLMDLHMPVMDGFSATQSIRASAMPGAATVPVISVSAESGADLPARLLEAGITDHLSKPIEMEALFAMIAKYL